MKPRAFLVQRLATFAALAVAFLIMASVFVPDRTRAEGNGSLSGEALGPSTDPHDGLISLGTLETGRYMITIYASARSPLYSIRDRDGGELGALLTPEQVEARFPDLPIRKLEFSAETEASRPLLIMRADPADERR